MAKGGGGMAAGRDMIEWQPDAAAGAGLAMVVTDARRPDMPVSFVNGAFEALTLYARDQVLGRNPRFLQGPGTDPRDVARIRDRLRDGQDLRVTVTNHRADGTPFRNDLSISLVRNAAGAITAHIGVLREAGPAPAPTPPPAPAEPAADDARALLNEMQHRVRNHLGLIASMIRIEARGDPTPEGLRGLGNRVEALALLYDEMLAAVAAADGAGMVSAAQYLDRIATVVAGLRPFPGIRVRTSLADVPLCLDQAARLGLVLSELLTNALEHAFRDRTEGLVTIGLDRIAGGSVRLSVRDDGVGLPAGGAWFGASPDPATPGQAGDGPAADAARPAAGTGGTILGALARSLPGRLRATRLARGTLMTVEFLPAAGPGAG
jgi:PAS domain S-box-containing protein